MTKRALVFPGQASQFVGMGSKLIERFPHLKDYMERADQLLDLPLSQVMLEGPEEDLRATNYTQPAVFLHSILVYKAITGQSDVSFDGVAGHSLGEITALVVAKALSFEDGLKLVKTRAEAMQEACESEPGTMAAILGMEDKAVEEICNDIDDIVVAANYNCPGQLVISGTQTGIAKAIQRCQDAGARRALEISVGGAFHSPLMKPALSRFASFIEQIDIAAPVVPIYQNVDARAETTASIIRKNLIDQIVSPVRWTQTIQNMRKDGITEFIEVGGKGKILMGMIRKIDRDLVIKIWGENE